MSGKYVLQQDGSDGNQLAKVSVYILIAIVAVAMGAIGLSFAISAFNHDSTQDIKLFQVNNSIVPIGGMIPWVGPASKVPKGWLICNGSTFSAVNHPILADLLGSNAVPDMRGFTVVGAGATSGIFNVALLASVGSETHILTVDEIPAHNHTANTGPEGGDHTHVFLVDGNGMGTTTAGQPCSGANTLAVNNCGNGWNDGVDIYTTFDSSQHVITTVASPPDLTRYGQHAHSFTTDSQGSGEAFNIVQPSRVMHYIIKAD